MTEWRALRCGGWPWGQREGSRLDALPSSASTINVIISGNPCTRGGHLEPGRKKKRVNGWERRREQESRVFFQLQSSYFVTAGSEKEPAAGKPTQLAECSSTLCLGTPGRCARWAGGEMRTGKSSEGSGFKYAVHPPPPYTHWTIIHMHAYFTTYDMHTGSHPHMCTEWTHTHICIHTSCQQRLTAGLEVSNRDKDEATFRPDYFHNHPFP